LNRQSVIKSVANFHYLCVHFLTAFLLTKVYKKRTTLHSKGVAKQL
jgi:hypothetical protein